MQAVYRLIWTSDVGFSGMDDRDFASLEAAQSAATAGVAWSDDTRDSWRSSRDQYGDAFTIYRKYR